MLTRTTLTLLIAGALMLGALALLYPAAAKEHVVRGASVVQLTAWSVELGAGTARTAHDVGRAVAEGAR